MTSEPLPPTERRFVIGWLSALILMVFGMVILGGITRLTGSGLSMVDWRPLMGTLPPLSTHEWERVFAQYQQSPQYELVNTRMDLSGFKQIFFFEYLHRLCGRLLGVVFVGGWVYLLVRKRLDRRMALRTGAAFVMGGMQGVMGWVMVKSGLVDVPEVSHFRLAAHLMLAFAVSQWMLWILLDVAFANASGGMAGLPSERRRPLLIATICFFALVCLQITYGAFMAGTKAGWLFTTFPDMNGAYGPAALRCGDGFVADVLSCPLTIHWAHRTLAWLCCAAAIALWWFASRGPLPARAKTAVRALIGLLFVQMTLGALTVIHSVPTSLAVAHQACAWLVLSVSLVIIHQVVRAAPDSAALA